LLYASVILVGKALREKNANPGGGAQESQEAFAYICINLTSGFFRESIVKTEEAGILAGNGFYHPSRSWQ
jgi:hypothetical protein